ncbi:response regulator [Marinicella sp. W31]|uniref:response regulator n=1 Tax=Marinicella sp. W31 TaxID=3023713 RepID=UPI00375797BF
MSTEILVVDDNHINIIYLQTMLTKLGYSAVSATDGHKAIDLCMQSEIHKTPFKLILMDIRMDGLDGIDTTKEIRKISAYRNIPIIAVSAEQVTHVADGFFQKTVIKPISRATLVDLTEEYLQKESTQYSIDKKPDVLQQLRQMLRQQLPQDIKKLKNTLAEDDNEASRQQIHYVLGSVKMCQLTEIESILINLQQVIMREGQLNQPQLMDKLEQACQKFCYSDK